MTAFDAIIIGAGQAGPPLAGRLTSAGMTVALIERHLFGGTCVNTGCMPTKTLVASAYAARLVQRAHDYGIVVSGPPQIDMARVKARADAVAEGMDFGTVDQVWRQEMTDAVDLGAKRDMGARRAAAAGLLRRGRNERRGRGRRAPIVTLRAVENRDAPLPVRHSNPTARKRR